MVERMASTLKRITLTELKPKSVVTHPELGELVKVETIGVDRVLFARCNGEVHVTPLDDRYRLGRGFVQVSLNEFWTMDPARFLEFLAGWLKVDDLESVAKNLGTTRYKIWSYRNGERMRIWTAAKLGAAAGVPPMVLAEQIDSPALAV